MSTFPEPPVDPLEPSLAGPVRAPAWWRKFLPTGRALRHRNYRLFFAGQGLSLIGTWMQQTAMPWLVYRLTNSELWLGKVAFFGQILTFLVAPFAGVLADRADRRRLLLITQSLAMVLAFVLAILTWTGLITPWHILVLSMLGGLVNAFDIPIRQSFSVEMLESRADLPNAIAMNSFLVNSAQLIGPSLAGVAIALLGEGTCFFMNGVSFLAVIWALQAMRLPPSIRPAREGHVLRHLWEGLIYAGSFKIVRSILLLLAVSTLLGVAYRVLFPVFARDVLGGGARTQGLLMTAVGAGAICGAIYLSRRTSVRGLGRAIGLASTLFGLALIAFGFSRNLYLSLGLLVLVGFGMMVRMASSNSLIQTIVDDDKRGRVMSFYVMAFMGMQPFGGLLAGWVAHRWDAPTAVMFGGAGCVVAALLFATRLPALGRLAHPIYVRLGLAPADGLGNPGKPRL